MMKPDRISIRPIRVVGLLLILQAIGLVGIIAYGILQVDWQQIQSGSSQQEGLVLEVQPDSPQQQEIVLEAVRAIGAAILFSPSIILAIIGALGFILSPVGDGS